jgi:hypothetical protein
MCHMLRAAVFGETQFRVRASLVAAAVVVLAAVGPAVAYVCHPDRAGTRMLSLRGTVDITSMRGTHVTVTAQHARSCQRIGWDVATGRHHSTSCATRTTQAATSPQGYRADIEGGYVVVRKQGLFVRRIWVGYSPLPLRATGSGSRVYVLTSPAANGPSRLLGFDVHTGLKTTDYPVPYSGSSLDVAAGVAIFGTTGGSGLYGLRLADG